MDWTRRPSTSRDRFDAAPHPPSRHRRQRYRRHRLPRRAGRPSGSTSRVTRGPRAQLLRAVPALRQRRPRSSAFDLLGTRHGGAGVDLARSRATLGAAAALHRPDSGVKPYPAHGVKQQPRRDQRTLTYAPSTKFYLQDRAAGTPWLTRLPFPVHVVERLRDPRRRQPHELRRAVQLSPRFLRRRRARIPRLRARRHARHRHACRRSRASARSARPRRRSGRRVRCCRRY